MRKTEFLQELKEALQGEVPASAVRENLAYYDQYITQEAASGRSEEDVIEEIGSPRLIARSIIDSSGGGAQGAGAYEDGNNAYSSGNDRESYEERRGGRTNFHYIDLNKWYWKALFYGALILILLVVFAVVGGIFSILFRFAGPIIVVLLIYKFIKDMWR